MTSADGAADGHDEIRLALGLYVLDKLPPAESGAIRHHLADCPACQSDCAELSALPGIFAMLSDDQRRALADEFGVSPHSDVRPAVVLVQNSSPRSTARQAPAPWFGNRIRLALAAAALILVAGVGIGVWLQGSLGSAPIGASVAATDAVTGATLSVTIGGRPGGADVHATIGGLEPGLQFRVIAVSADGTTQIIFEAIAAGAEQKIDTTIGVAPADLAFFTVAKLDGSVLVTVRVTDAAG